MPSGRACASIPRQTYLLPSAICTMNATSRVWWDAPAASSPRPGSAVWSWGEIPELHLFFFFFLFSYPHPSYFRDDASRIARFLFPSAALARRGASEQARRFGAAGWLSQAVQTCVRVVECEIAPCHAKVPAMPHPAVLSRLSRRPQRILVDDGEEKATADLLAALTEIPEEDRPSPAVGTNVCLESAFSM